MKKTSAVALISVLAAILVAVILLSVLTVGASGTILYGDANGDGKLNNRDVGLLQQYLNDWDVQLGPKDPDLPPPTVSTTTTQTSTTYPITTTTRPATTTTTIIHPGDVLGQVPEALSGQKIKMMSWWFPSAEDTAKVDTFYKETGIKVTFETATLDKYQSTLFAKNLAGNPPQAAAIRNEWYPIPITRNLFQPLSATGWGLYEDIYATELMEQFSYKGEMYGIALKGSLASDFEVMYFNETLLKAKGVDKTPYDLWKAGDWNWATLMDIAAQCADSAQGQYAMTLPSHHSWMLSAGLDLITSGDNGLQNNVTSAKVLDAWNHAWDVVNTYKYATATFDPQLFYTGSVALMGGTTSEGSAVAAACDFEPGVVPFPSPLGLNPVSAAKGTVWGIPAGFKGDKVQAAMWWLRYYLDDAHYTDRASAITPQCVEVLDGMYDQRIQSFNSAGPICYGNVYSLADVESSIIVDAKTKAMVLTQLRSWETLLDSSIFDVENF